MRYEEALAAAITYEERHSNLKETVAKKEGQSKEHELMLKVDKLNRDIEREQLTFRQELEQKELTIQEVTAKIDELR